VEQKFLEADLYAFNIFFPGSDGRDGYNGYEK
jgi:hypothetical protein